MSNSDYSKFLEKAIKFFIDPHVAEVTNLLKELHCVIPYKMCSLWKINNVSGTVSVYARYGYSPPTEKSYEYVHPINNSLIGEVIESIKRTGKIFEYIDLTNNNIFKQYHKAPERIAELNLSTLLSIPIINSDKDSAEYKYDAVLNIYPSGKYNKSSGARDIEFIRDFIGICLAKIRSTDRESIVDDAIQIYQDKKNKQLSDFLHPIVHRVIQKKIPCEACSIFKWDTNQLRLTLAATTGIDPSSNISPRPFKEMFYYLGEGVTGAIAKVNKPKIINDFSRIEDPDLIGKHKNWIIESTPHDRKSYIGVPITKPSNSKEVIGVIRLINRLNPENNAVVDHFSAEDLDLLNSLISILSFIFEIHEIERRQAAFAVQITHEIKNPAAFIKNTSDLIRKKIPDNILIEYDSKKLLDRIFHRAESLINTSYQIKIVTKKYDSNKQNNYKLSYTSIKDSCHKARITIYDFLKQKNFSINNIEISGPHFYIFFDQYALERVFINILTNAVKYRDHQSTNELKIEIDISKEAVFSVKNRLTSTINEMEGVMVKVRDYGLGIPEVIENNIFEMGFRYDTAYSEPGYGLGLAFVDEIMRDFKSYIWISSNKNPTEFSLFFPIFLKSEEEVQKCIQESQNDFMA